LFPLAQPLPAFACRTWIIHVLQQMVRGLVTVFVHSNQPIWFGPGAQPTDLGRVRPRLKNNNY
jgi:hypothetical protein